MIPEVLLPICALALASCCQEGIALLESEIKEKEEDIRSLEALRGGS